MTVETCDLLIVGAGPAGLSTWLHLHALAPELARQTIVVDKQVHPRPKICGGGVTGLADALLGGLGIQLDCDAVPVHEIRFRFGARELVLERQNVFRVVRRHDFDAALARVAVERGMVLHQGAGIDGLRFTTSGVECAAGAHTYKAAVVVGADGAHSVVRRSIAGDRPDFLARVMDCVVPHADDRPVAHVDFTPVSSGLQGYAWRFPCRDGGRPAANAGLADTGLFPEQPRRDLRALFSASLVTHQVDAPPSTWASHPVRWFTRDGIFAAPRALLAGDAAGIDPAVGEGIAQALDYGDLAANALIDAFRRADFSFRTYRRRLLAHPVGRTLMARSRLAHQLYAPGGDAMARLQELLPLWLPGSGATTIPGV